MASKKDTSKQRLTNIKKIAKELKDLKGYSNGQYKTVEKLTGEIQKKDEEIVHLKYLLQQCIPKLKEDFDFKIISDEEQISLMQLDKLKQKAVKRELTLEETKKFDILVKNKRLSQGKSTNNTNTSPHLKDVTPKDLIVIAESNPKKKD